MANFISSSFIAAKDFMGLYGVDHRYNRDTYTADSKRLLPKDSSCFLGKKSGPRELTDTAISVLVDDVIEITTVADSLRKESQKYWQERRTGAKNLTYAGIATGLAGVAAWIGAVKMLPAILAITAIGTIILGLARMHATAVALRNWRDPVVMVCEARNSLLIAREWAFPKAYQGDFVNLFYISPKELENLYQGWAPAFMRQFTTGVLPTADQIKSFFALNPLDRDVLKTIFSTRLLPDLQTLSDRYEAVKAHFTDLQKDVQKDKARIESHARTQIDLLNYNFTTQTANYKIRLDELLIQALEDYNKTLGFKVENAINSEQIANAKQAHANAKRQANNAYELATAPFIQECKIKIAEVEFWKKSEIAKIEQQGQAATRLYGEWVGHFASAYNSAAYILPTTLPFTDYSSDELPTYNFGNVQPTSYLEKPVDMDAAVWDYLLLGQQS